MTSATLTESMELVALLFEALGALVLIGGVMLSAWLAIRCLLRSRDPRAAYLVLRESFGGAILLALEVLVAADLVRTVAIAPTLENVAILGLIVLIRTVLSFALETRSRAWRPGGERRPAESGTSPVPPPAAGTPDQRYRTAAVSPDSDDAGPLHGCEG